MNKSVDNLQKGTTSLCDVWLVIFLNSHHSFAETFHAVSTIPVHSRQYSEGGGDGYPPRILARGLLPDRRKLGFQEWCVQNIKVKLQNIATSLPPSQQKKCQKMEPKLTPIHELTYEFTCNLRVLQPPAVLILARQYTILFNSNNSGERTHKIFTFSGIFFHLATMFWCNLIRFWEQPAFKVLQFVGQNRHRKNPKMTKFWQKKLGWPMVKMWIFSNPKKIPAKNWESKGGGTQNEPKESHPHPLPWKQGIAKLGSQLRG